MYILPLQEYLLGLGALGGYMKVLSLDLSLNGSGMSVLEVKDGKIHILTTRLVDNKKIKCFGEKLKRIADTLEELIDTYAPDVICREKGFTRFAGTTQKLFKVVGVSDLIAYHWGYTEELPEYSPTTVKKHLACSGKAEKSDVEKAVREFLVDGQKEIEFITNDISDAVAVGITHLLAAGMELERG